jgi:hypothetical protein
MECRTLSHQQAKALYDRFGKKQDSQSFYEDIAINALIRKYEFDIIHYSGFDTIICIRKA